MAISPVLLPGKKTPFETERWPGFESKWKMPKGGRNAAQQRAKKNFDDEDEYETILRPRRSRRSRRC
jgi:hypothetical protein